MEGQTLARAPHQDGRQSEVGRVELAGSGGRLRCPWRDRTGAGVPKNGSRGLKRKDIGAEMRVNTRNRVEYE